MNLAPSQTLELDITDVAFGGDGVGRAQGIAVFVPFVIPGERVRVEVVSVSKRYARARLCEILAASPDRVSPPCPFFGRCGGCRYQHVAYDRQAAIKQKQVSDALLRGGRHAGAAIRPMVASPKAYGYRNRIELHGPGRPAYQGLDGRSLVPVDRCLLAEDSINQVLASPGLPDLAARERLLLRAAPDGTVRVIRRNETEESGRARPSPGGVDGVEDVSERVAGLALATPAASFFQVNRAVLELVIEAVRAEFNACGCVRFLEAHAGVGVFSLALAGSARECVGVEADADAAAAARRNAATLGAGHCRFENGLAESLVPDLLAPEVARETCLFLDPPRGGCDADFLTHATRCRPGQVLYLSCSPPMLARDAAALAQAGYALQRLTPFDMFPQTAQVETLAVFQPREPAP
jgi:tRNA/tmRNA/rRNA uracil-C5-methylase (TrmA/RlmC/RlmD family)